MVKELKNMSNEKIKILEGEISRIKARIRDIQMELSVLSECAEIHRETIRELLMEESE